MKKYLHITLIATLFCLVAFSGVRCAQEKSSNHYVKEAGMRFSTIYHFTYKSDSSVKSALDSTLDVFSHSLNPFDSTSIISSINKNKSFATDSLFRNCFRTAMHISQLTGGLYDITCSQLVNVWGFGYRKPFAHINQKVIDSLLQDVGYKKIHLEGDKIVKDNPNILLDASSLSKGYSADLVAGTLSEKYGINDYLIEIGGEIAFNGKNPNGEPWHVGIDKPILDSTSTVNDISWIVELKGKGGLATSGNYRNYKTVNGKRVAHTIDPITGYPIQTDVLSATIIAPSCMLADALATAVMACGSKEAPRLAKELPGVEYFLVVGTNSDSMKTITSKYFNKHLVKIER